MDGSSRAALRHRADRIGRRSHDVGEGTADKREQGHQTRTVIDLRDQTLSGETQAGETAAGSPEVQSSQSLWERSARWGTFPLIAAADVIACLVPILLFPDTQRLATIFGFCFVLLIAGSGLYRSRLTMSVLDDLPRLAAQFLMALASTTAIEFVIVRLGGKALLVDWNLIKAAMVAGVLTVCFKGLAYALVRHQRASGRVRHRTVILGAGAVGAQIAKSLLEHPEYGLEPVGFLDSDPVTSARERSGLPVLADAAELADVLLEGRIKTAIIAFSRSSEAEFVSVVRTCDRMQCELFVVPRFFELHARDTDMDEVWGMPLVRLRRRTYRTYAWQIKRVIDVALSGLAILLLSPIMAVAALAVRLDGGPGIIFRQQRVGVDGRMFTIMKYRSMRPATEAESQTNWNISQDSRLSPIGKFLRKTSIDELPQLWNILRGDMSIVGPRPERPHFVQQFREAYPGYVARHRVPCGLTGWAAVHGLRGDTSIAERARFDNYYIENWSLWLDLKIMIRTVTAVFRATGG